MFTCVAAVGYAKAEVKVKILEKASLEVMPLNHTEAVNGPFTHCELNPAVGKETQHRSHFKGGCLRGGKADD